MPTAVSALVLGSSTRRDTLPRSRDRGREVGIARYPPPEELPLPQTGRRWAERAKEYVEKKRSEDEVTEGWLERVEWDIGRTPDLLRRVGVSPVPPPNLLQPEHVRLLKTGLGWGTRTTASYFAALRPFLRWSGNPVANRKGIWGLPSGEATHRRWLSETQLASLYRGASDIALEFQQALASSSARGFCCHGMSQVLVVLEGFNALRRIEVRRLRVRDVDLPSGRMKVLGKGRRGGKWRTVPITQTTSAVLGPWLSGKNPRAFVLPGRDAEKPISESACDSLIRLSAKRAGLTASGVSVSNHDLRRTFGRVAYQAGMNLVDLKNFFGHKSVDMTAHYIGLDEDHMREGLAKFDAKMVPLLAVSLSQPLGAEA